MRQAKAYKLGKNKIAADVRVLNSVGGGAGVRVMFEGEHMKVLSTQTYSGTSSDGAQLDPEYDKLIRGCPEVTLRPAQVEKLMAHPALADVHEPYVSATITQTKGDSMFIEYTDIHGDVTTGRWEKNRKFLEGILESQGFEKIVIEVSKTISREFWIQKELVAGWKASVVPNPNGYPRVAA